MSGLYEAGAHARLIEAGNLASVTERKLVAARNDMVAAKLAELVRQLDKATKLHRLFSTRPASILSQLGTGDVR